MNRRWHLRVLLAVAVAAAVGNGDARAQRCGNDCRPPPPNNPPPLNLPSARDNPPWALLGGILAPIIGIGIKIQFFPDNGPGTTVAQHTLAPRQSFNGQPPGNPP